MINCAKCGKQTITEVVAGKQTKNCRPCRAIHNNNSKRTPILKCEKLPDQGFYKQEKYNMVDNDPEEEQDEPEDPEDPEEKPEYEQDKQEAPKQEKTIRDLLTDIFNKFDELEKASKEQIKKQN